jgi:hypothetical protein
MQIKDSQELQSFEEYLHGIDIQTRNHVGFNVSGIQVRYQKHWMAVVWNKNNKSYTVDSRLNKLFQDFKSMV